MDDIFYFTDQRIDLSAVEKVASSCGYRRVRRFPGGVQIWVKRSDEPTLSCSPFDLTEAEPEEQNELRELGVQSAFCISHHRDSIQLLIPMLESLLNTFGGWVGNDDDGFNPRFDRTRIQDFSYPE